MITGSNPTHSFPFLTFSSFDLSKISDPLPWNNNTNYWISPFKPQKTRKIKMNLNITAMCKSQPIIYTLVKLLADIKLLKIWTFEIPAAVNLLQKLPALHEALLFALISSKFFSGIVRELIIQGSPVRSSAGKFFKKKFLQKSSFLLSNCNIHTPFEIRNIFQWSVLFKNVNESLTDYVKYQIFKAS